MDERLALRLSRVENDAQASETIAVGFIWTLVRQTIMHFEAGTAYGADIVVF